jgi:hypothetical protein
MLPKNFNLEYLDEGIEDLVINLNRIPEVDTATTCEGHVWENIPAWPTKDGWIHFLTEKYEDLLLKIDYWCQEKGFFELDVGELCGHKKYTILGKYEPHHDDEYNNLFEKMNAREKKDYFKRVGIRRKEILKGWEDLNNLVVDYIKNHINEDIESLEYRE